MKETSSVKIVAVNRKARHDYFIDEKFEAGIELFGTEVKSIRAGEVNLRDSYCHIDNNLELFALGIHISPYKQGNRFNTDPDREKRLLMHKKEIVRLSDKINQKGYTLIPLSIYLKSSRVKIEIGLCRGKKLYDKRDDEAKRQAERDIDRAVRQKEKY